MTSCTEPLTRRQLAQLIANRNRKLALQVRHLAHEDCAAWCDLMDPIDQARIVRRLARAMVAGDDAWAMVWIRRARHWPEDLQAEYLPRLLGSK